MAVLNIISYNISLPNNRQRSVGKFRLTLCFTFHWRPGLVFIFFFTLFFFFLTRRLILEVLCSALQPTLIPTSSNVTQHVLKWGSIGTRWILIQLMPGEFYLQCDHKKTLPAQHEEILYANVFICATDCVHGLSMKNRLYRSYHIFFSFVNT